MRSRNIKPGFFKNEILGTADPLISILFAGLWCVADREGRLEDRPLRLCAELFPYRRTVTNKKVDAMLRWLHENGFITRYEAAGRQYIQVLEFSKHQNPHKHEAPSKIPALSSISYRTGTMPSTGHAQDMHRVSMESAPDRSRCCPADSLIPDSSLREIPLPPHSEGPLANGSGAKRASGGNPRARGTNPRAVAAAEALAARWKPLHARAQASGFRDPWDIESPDIYETALRVHERDHPTQRAPNVANSSAETASPTGRLNGRTPH